MRTIKRTKQFKRDYKREKYGRYRKILNHDLVTVISLLITDAKLPKSLYDHSLTGDLKDYRDCHVKPDLVLIYRKINNDILELIRLGSHSELGI